MATHHPYLLEFLPLIPHGRVVSYKFLSHLFGIHPRKIASVLTRNTDHDAYPCFKVVYSDGKLGGYNLWVDEKIRRLRGEDVVVREGKIEWSYFWEPSISQIFVGFPVVDRNLFREMADSVKPAVEGHEYVRFQSERTPHATVQFFGQLSGSGYVRLLKKLWAFDLAPYGGEEVVYCDVLGNFHSKVFYVAPSPIDIGYFQWVFRHLSSSLWLPLGDREYIPHVTLFRSEFPLREEVLSEIEKRLAGFLLPVSIQRLVLYATVEDHKQVPLIEFGESGSAFLYGG